MAETSAELKAEPEFENLIRSPGIDSQPGGPGTTALFDVPDRQAT